MKKLVLLTACCLTLTGCGPTVFVAGAATTGVAGNDNRTFTTKWDDQKIAVAVRQKLYDNENFRYKASVSTAVYNRSVLLTGNVPNEDMHQQAVDIAKSVYGVKRVHDQLKVGPKISISQAAQDTWITTKVKTAMLAETDLNSTQFKVVTDHGHVYLLGLVTRSQADLATNVTQHVPGVGKITKLFEYL